MEATKICCQSLKLRLVRSKFSKIVLGGTAASHTCSGVGGGHFLVTKFLNLNDRAQGSNQGAVLSLGARTATQLAVSVESALGILFRFQIPDFDIFFRLFGLFAFFSLCHVCFPFRSFSLLPPKFEKLFWGGTAAYDLLGSGDR